jgi:PIN domain nuclease of toxin-antitoxin system
LKLLLDTHAFVWAIGSPRFLSPRAKALITDELNVVLVSAVSAYEIEYNRPRDPILSALPPDLGEVVDLARFEWLELKPAHASAAGRLPRLSGDPFDRMLAAQALTEQAAIVTRDPRVAAYGPLVAW